MSWQRIGNDTEKLISGLSVTLFNDFTEVGFKHIMGKSRLRLLEVAVGRIDL